MIRILKGSAAARIGAAALFLFAIATTVSIAAGHGPVPRSSLATGPRVSAPRNARIKVQILNASKAPGYPARAVRYLRDRGFDVVESGRSSEKLESTVVIARTGRGDWARLVGLALGAPNIQSVPDSARYVDVTILLGSDWSPPGPLDP